MSCSFLNWLATPNRRTEADALAHTIAVDLLFLRPSATEADATLLEMASSRNNLARLTLAKVKPHRA